MTADLGDPWVIAQTIIDAEEAKRGTGRNAGSSYTTANSGFSDPVYGDGGDYTREDYYDQNQGYQAHVHTFGFDTWWKKAQQKDPELLNFERSFLINDDAEQVSKLDFPNFWHQGNLKLKLTYQFEPGTDADA